MNIFKRTGTPQAQLPTEDETVIDLHTAPATTTSQLSVTPSSKGTFIVIEGTDGSGKGTQFELLRDRLQNEGYAVATFDFPRYEEPSSYFVQQYLNGRYGGTEDVGPYVASLFYALDRYEAAAGIREALDAGKVVLANRYVASNMAHQGTKIPNAEQRRGYFIWLDNLEFEMLGIPRPDLNLVLRVPADTAQQLIDQKAERSYTKLKRDIHEADLDHLKRAVEVYDDLVNLFPKDFQQLDCVRSGELLSIDAVQKLVWESAQPHLPTIKSASQSKTKVAAATVKPTESTKATVAKEAAQDNPYVEQSKHGLQPSKAGQEYLQQAVTDVTGDVYGFTDKLSPVTIAAAMARLSRRGDDMRLTILDEFAHAMGKDEKLLHRVITAYGDDSVQQLVGIPMVVENASNILTKKLEWGRLGSYLEQSTRYIYFDQKDADGNYRYFTPSQFDDDTRRQYRQMMDDIFDRYAAIVRQLTDYVRSNDPTPETERDVAWKGATRAQACDAARPLLPVATTSTVGMFMSGQALESCIMHLLSDDLAEARAVGENMLREARKIVPTFLERADKPERGGATIAYRNNTSRGVAELVAQHLDTPPADGSYEPVTLTDVWPRNEFDLIPDMMYEHSDQPLETLREATAAWSYDQKAAVFEAYMGERLNRRHRPGRAIEKAHYSFDLVCDYGIFRDLQRHRMVDDLEWQQLTPRLGYEVPDLVSQAGLTEGFEECFEISVKLHGLLQQRGFALEAQYATLLGHRMRWKVTYNAREAFHLHELRTSPQGHPGYRKLVSEMHEAVKRVHPVLADAMRFVNQDEDPALTRLAAERYTQYKLQILSAEM